MIDYFTFGDGHTMQIRPLLIGHRLGQVMQVIFDVALLGVPSLPLKSIVMNHLNILLENLRLVSRVVIQEPLKSNHHVSSASAEPHKIIGPCIVSLHWEQVGIENTPLGCILNLIAILLDHTRPVVLQHSVHERVEAIQRIENRLLIRRVGINKISEAKKSIYIN